MTPQDKRLHICIVCTGNICRSPIAALVLGKHVRREGLADRVTVSSAGVEDWHVGKPADHRAVSVLRLSDYPVIHTAKKIDDRDLAADLLLAMDSGHYQVLARMLGESSRLRMFRSFAPQTLTQQDVPDPYHGEPQGFDEVLSMVEDGTAGILEWIRETLGIYPGKRTTETVGDTRC